MGYLHLIGRTAAGLTKFSSAYIRCSLGKRTAIKRFEQELIQSGLPLPVVKQLTEEYADMVNLNPIDYAKIWRKQK
ncbi:MULTISPECIES: hypothetical protein [Thermoactinomyces]|jgi:hypothetical protein|uniref:Uncharacterized protein n=1 Tax=Thermoactinomyces daqus TaxID=1329516 RepID=A0A7W2AJ37_9BACL|nr:MULTISPECIES: hypothetical protein [Thermoactinomyces]MBA4543553.1 hypothetical protein [Thermoactinomyces daqus]MBH8599112.1 hypothetical protein [Thermoactinomyces sp. CICC 10523]MBH8605751.1 hypothetical protein [Thermoactinomyces sp. CICC 10522]MBH8607956.1 hypothetical protein [Thermoactinomyces sp. CICC 10521]